MTRDKITAVIPARSGSQRIQNKNIREWTDTNLLTHKIKTLQSVTNIDTIVVNSNDPDILNIASSLGVETHLRDPYYASNTISNSEFHVSLAESIDAPVMMYAHAMCPFVSSEEYIDMIETFFSMDTDRYDSVISVRAIQDYLWDEQGPINYDLSDTCTSQNLPIYYIPTFACCIQRTQDVLANKNVIGQRPLFVPFEQVGGIDIDWSSDFMVSELCQLHSITTDSIPKQIMSRRPQQPMFLDCTIRDGGFKYDFEFSDEMVLDCYKAVSESGMDYFEIGYREKRNPGVGRWCFADDDMIRECIGGYRGCKISVMVSYDYYSSSNFVHSSMSPIDMIRILIYERHLDSMEQVCRDVLNLIHLGYEVCVNLHSAHNITTTQLEYICSYLNELPIHTLYLADTYGSFTPSSLSRTIHTLYRYTTCRIGFHGHDNRGDALVKTNEALLHGCGMVDSCIGGLGRGAGNTKSEILMMERKKNFLPLISFGVKYIFTDKPVGYHPLYALSAQLNLHPDVALKLL